MSGNRGVISGDKVVRSSLPDVLIPDQDLPTYIWSRALDFGDHSALTCGVTGRSYSFKEARSLSQRFGASLLKKGLRSGDVLAVMLPNTIEFPSIVLGALEAGLVVTTINALFKKNELLLQLRTTGPKAIVTVPPLVPLVSEVLHELEARLPIISVDNEGTGSSDTWDFRDLVGSAILRQFPKVPPDSAAILPCSSGTTSQCKVIVRTHKNIVASLAIPSGFRNPLLDMENRDIRVTALPVAYSYGQQIIWSGLITGAHVLILPPEDPRVLIHNLTKQKPLSVQWFCYPRMISELNPLVKPEDLKSLSLILCAGSPPVRRQIEEFLNKLPSRKDVTFVSCYGISEASPLFSPLPNDLNPEAIGYPLTNVELRVVDSSGANLGPGDPGELYVRGPQVMKCYLNNKKATADAFDGDWFKTGDVVYYDEEGFFYLVDRLKDLIKVGGSSVSPVELEAVLLSHPNLADAGVVGVPDDKTGEKPVAFVVLKPGVKVDPEVIREFVASRVAPHKTLSKIILTKALPRNSGGKLLKTVLKEEYSKMTS